MGGLNELPEFDYSLRAQAGFATEVNAEHFTKIRKLTERVSNMIKDNPHGM